jgi:peptidoglycan/LPS O-acetylase OafA/YrhL
MDAVRGLAVLWVMVHDLDRYPSLHLGPLSNNGWMGVDLFFVVSGGDDEPIPGFQWHH